MPSEQFLHRFLDRLQERSEVVPHHYLSEEDRTLDPHQVRAMDAISNEVRDSIGNVGNVHISIQQGGGSGKTTLIANLVGAALDTRAQLRLKDGKIIVLATERALIHGVRKELKHLGIAGEMIGQWGNGKKQLDRSVVLASIQAAQLAPELASNFPQEDNLLVIGDEADAYLTEARQETVRNLGGVVRVGLTATPEWPDGRHVEDLWGPLVTEFPLLEGIRAGVNVPPVWTLHEANIDESAIGVEGGDYKDKEKAQAYAAIEIENSIGELYENLVPRESREKFPALIYVPSTLLVHRVADSLQKRFADLRIRRWTGDITSSKDLHRDVEEYESGKVDVLVLCRMGGRGLNVPHARVLIDADPTLSPTKLEQRHARVLRRLRDNEEEKPFSVIAQIVPRSTKNRCVCLPDVLEGSWEQAKRREPLGLVEGGYGRARLERIQAYTERLANFKPVVHLTLVERFDLYAPKTIRETKLVKGPAERIAELQSFREQNPERWPMPRSKNATERSLCGWLAYARGRLRDDERFAQGEGKALLEMGVEPAVEQISLSERIAELQSFREQNPEGWPPRSKNATERSLGMWLSNARRRLRKDEHFAQGEGKVLLEMGVEPAVEQISLSERIAELQSFREQNPERWPSENSENAPERSLCGWLAYARRRLRDDERFAQGEGKALLEMGVEPAVEQISLAERIAELQSFREQNPERWPSENSENAPERSLGMWLSNARRRLRKDEHFAQGEGKVLLEMGVKPARKKGGQKL